MGAGHRDAEQEAKICGVDEVPLRVSCSRCGWEGYESKLLSCDGYMGCPSCFSDDLLEVEEERQDWVTRE